MRNKEQNKIAKDTLNSDEKLQHELGELRLIKDQFDLFLNHVDDFIWVLNRDIKFSFISPSVEQVLGYKANEVINTSPLDVCHPESFDKLNKVVQERKKGIINKKSTKWELAFSHKNKDTVWLDTITKPIFNSSGEFDGIMGVSRDITFKRAREDERRKERANLKAQIENTTDNIWSVDKRFKVITLNSNFRNNFKTAYGVSIEKGSNIIDTLEEPLASEWKNRYERAMKGEVFKVTDHYEIQDISQYMEVSFNPIILDNEIIGVSCFARDITDRMMADQALKESETRFKTLVANLPSVAFRCKVDDYWTMNFISKEIENLSGYKPEDFIDNNAIPFAHIILAEDNEAISKIILDAVLNHRSYSVEYRITHKNGSVKWVHERGRGNYNIHNEIEWLDGVISDITSRKEAEEKVKESERKFKSFFENSSSPIVIMDVEKIYIVNKAWENIMGYTAEEAKTINPIDLVHPQSKESFVELTKTILRGSKTPKKFHLHVLDKNKQEKWLDISASFINYEGKKTILIVGSEITEQKNSDLQIKKLSAGIMNTPSSIVITDIDGVIEYVNPFFCEFTGYSYEEVIGGNPNLLNSGNNPPELFKNLWNTILSGEVWQGEIENRKKDGSLYWEIARIAPILNEEGIVVSFVAIKEDITERKRYQEMIEQSEKDLRELNAKKDKFFSIIAHDLRSPLVGLVGLTNLLKDNHKELSEEKLNHYLKYANEASQNVFKLLENLLEWSKSQTGKVEFRPEPIDLSELIQDAFGVANLAAQNKEITLVNFAFSNEQISVDKNMIFTILRNLISNAIKYTPKGGRIEVDAEKKERQMIVSVKDNGVGIAPDKIEKLFLIEENISTKGTEKETGSGLGLIICKEFIEKHGGNIWVESTPDKGSTFSFSLPIFNR